MKKRTWLMCLLLTAEMLLPTRGGGCRGYALAAFFLALGDERRSGDSGTTFLWYAFLSP